MIQRDREATRFWEEYKENILRSTPEDTSMSSADIEKHRAYLEKHVLKWIKFFFPTFCTFEFASFQIAAIMRLIANGEWYEVLSWARSLAKSTIVMFVVLFLVLTGKKKNVILASATQDAAIRLLKPYKINLEANGRIKQYYGIQEGTTWKEDNFITKKGVSFLAVGAGNAPRGSRNEAVRPDILLVDDFDTDEACRNPDTIKKNWEWWEKALYGTRDPQIKTLIIFCGNIIAKDCCITRAGAMANHWDIVNIRDKNGNSTWPEKNTEEMITSTLSKISTQAQQTEYFNNPISEGKIFKNCIFGKIPILSKFRYLVIYGDPAPGESKSKKSSTKSVWLMGKHEGKFFIIKGFIGRELNSTFIDWYIQLLEWVASRVPVYCYMENNKLQDPFFKQVFQPLVAKARNEHGVSLNIKGDVDKKTDKAVRIEANLEPLDRDGLLIFNEAEKDNPHMKELVDQFKLFEMTIPYPADGPDCIEGGLRIINNKQHELQPKSTIDRATLKKQNKHRR